MHELEDIDPEQIVCNPRRRKIDAALKKNVGLARRKRSDADAPRKAVKEGKKRDAPRKAAEEGENLDALKKSVEEGMKRDAPGKLGKVLMEIASIDGEIAERNFGRRKSPHACRQER